MMPMVALSAQDILAVWEIGQGQCFWERGLMMLGYACPGESEDKLAKLPVGERDRILLSLREKTLGSRLAGLAVCPQCREQLEFSLSTEALTQHRASQNAPASGLSEMTFGEFRLQYRLPDSSDLADAARARTPEEGRAVLLVRCLTEVKRQGVEIPVGGIPEEVISALEEQMSAEESGGEILIQLTCSACQHAWSLAFDIVSFFYAEISALARRLLREVHYLASYYGWSEKEILAMSDIRRHFYLDRVV